MLFTFTIRFPVIDFQIVSSFRRGEKSINILSYRMCPGSLLFPFSRSPAFSWPRQDSRSVNNFVRNSMATSIVVQLLKNLARMLKRASCGSKTNFVFPRHHLKRSGFTFSIFNAMIRSGIRKPAGLQAREPVNP